MLLFFLVQINEFEELSDRLDEGGRDYLACGSFETAKDGIVVVCASGKNGTNQWSDKTWLYKRDTGELFYGMAIGVR